MDALLRRIAELNAARLPGDNAARLPGDRVPFLLGAEQVGWLAPALAAAVGECEHVRAGPAGVVLDRPETLPAMARALADRGLLRWRGEAFDVRAAPDGPALSTIDRGALPAFGIEAQGIHLDGVVRRAGGLHVWIARRSPTKALDPGKLDHIVAGGMPAGHTPFETLVKEAAEEAAMPAALAAGAVATGTLRYAMERPEGLRRDLLHCYEVELPEDFVPLAHDGEVAGFELWPMARLADALRAGAAAFKFNVVAALALLLLRHGAFTPDEAARIAAALPRGDGAAAAAQM
jgi:8-oxo-dGTP pyrophosphatase MutT (NUDIX family)